MREGLYQVQRYKNDSHLKKAVSSLNKTKQKNRLEPNVRKEREDDWGIWHSGLLAGFINEQLGSNLQDGEYYSQNRKLAPNTRTHIHIRTLTNLTCSSRFPCMKRTAHIGITHTWIVETGPNRTGTVSAHLHCFVKFYISQRRSAVNMTCRAQWSSGHSDSQPRFTSSTKLTSYYMYPPPCYTSDHLHTMFIASNVLPHYTKERL